MSLNFLRPTIITLVLALGMLPCVSRASVVFEVLADYNSYNGVEFIGGVGPIDHVYTISVDDMSRMDLNNGFNGSPLSGFMPNSDLEFGKSLPVSTYSVSSFRSLERDSPSSTQQYTVFRSYYGPGSYQYARYYGEGRFVTLSYETSASTLTELFNFLTSEMDTGFLRNGTDSYYNSNPFVYDRYGFTAKIISVVDTDHPTAATPEPGTMLLMGIGAAGVAFMRRRKQGNAN